jgi:tetratricopeptide (TPR) repeat protein
VKRAVLLAIVLSSSTAAADASANELFARAQARYEAGDYRQAITLFEEAYQLVRDPVYLFNIGQAYRKLFDCVPAATHFERYLAEAPDADAGARSKVKQALEELAPCVEERTRVAPKPIERKPVEEPPQPIEVAPVIDDRGRGLRIGGLAMAGTGVVALVVGSVYSAKGAGYESDLAACAAGCEWTAELEDIEGKGERANTLATVGWITGGVAVAGGVTLYLLGRSKRNERAMARSFTITPTRGGAAVSFRF